MFKIFLISEDVDNSRKIEKMVGENSACELRRLKSLDEAIGILNPKPPKASAPGQEAAPVPTPTVPVVNLILLEIAKIESAPVKGILEFREALKGSPSENAFLCLLSHDKDPDYIRRFLLPGVVDILVKPVMASVMKATLDYFITGAVRPLIKTKGLAELFFEVAVMEISEFDILISTKKKVPENEFKSIFGDVFQWTPNQRVIARCSKCEDDAKNAGFFAERLTYIGVQPGITKEIRIWLKKEYIQQKERGEAG